MGGALLFGQTLDILFIIYSVQKSIRAAKSKILLKPCGQSFWNLNFFFILRGKVTDITRKKPIWAHIIFIHKSYSEIVDKIVKWPENRAKMRLYIFERLYLTFASNRLFIFSGFIVFQGMMQIN